MSKTEIVVVPREPTPNMLAVGLKADGLLHKWYAMVDAAPSNLVISETNLLNMLRDAYEDGFRDGDLAKERGDHFGEAMKDGWLTSDAYKTISGHFK